MAKFMTPKTAIRLVSVIVVLVIVGVVIALQIAPKADTIKTVISNKASVSYESNGATATKTSNTVTTTLEPTIPSPLVPSPTPPAGRIFTSVEGSRSTLQRFKLSALTTEKAVITFVFDYYPKDKPLPSADAVIKTTRRLQLDSSAGISHTVDQSGNANQYVVGYFEAKVGNQIVEQSDYYYFDTAIGSTLAPLP